MEIRERVHAFRRAAEVVLAQLNDDVCCGLKIRPKSFSVCRFTPVKEAKVVGRQLAQQRIGRSYDRRVRGAAQRDSTLEAAEQRRQWPCSRMAFTPRLADDTLHKTMHSAKNEDAALQRCPDRDLEGQDRSRRRLSTARLARLRERRQCVTPSRHDATPSRQDVVPSLSSTPSERHFIPCRASTLIIHKEWKTH